MPSLDVIAFDVSGFVLLGDKDGARFWHTSAGDVVVLYYFDKRPDIGADLGNLDALRAFYRTEVTAAGLGLIEVDTFQADGCVGVRTVFKSPRRPAGVTYLGSLTLPFRDFSFVLKVECNEAGITGQREAVVLNEMLASGRVTLGDTDDGLVGWAQDPYDPAARARLMRNLSEDERYDGQFPDHPLSRLRAALRKIGPSVRLGAGVKEARPFVFNTPPAKRPWWKKR